ncbi:MAG TPA: ATP-binding protein, partial [Thiolinea sp.]|nr:ATP-binding protein [Thiolinea sp.]
FLLVETERFDQSLATLTSVGTLIFMLLLAVLQAERVRMLREHTKQIEAANLAKEQFLAVMSHELRTPMSAIMGLSTLLKLSPLDSKQQNYLQKLDSATEHIMQLLNNVLDYAKVTNYTFQLKPEPCRLSVVVQSTLPLIQPLAEQKGLKLVFENQGELETNLLLDRTCLTQVLLNLLTNAVKYTPEGSVRLKIQILAAQHQYQQVRFNISDTGVGFPQELLSYLFEPFTQLTPQNSQQGVGLGLAISKRLVTLMGSELTVQSQVGQGTSISFVVKFLLAPALPQMTTQLDMLTKGLRLLVADNAELNNPEASAMLRQLGANVHVVPNGQGAILCLQEEDVDMVLVDMSLPDLGGLELGRWVRHSGRNPRLPIVALTSNTLTEIEPVCRELGINAYLHKPLDYQSLSTTLNRALAA